MVCLQTETWQALEVAKRIFGDFWTTILAYVVSTVSYGFPIFFNHFRLTITTSLHLEKV